MKLLRLIRPDALVAHLLMLVLTSAAVALGFWQLGTWKEHRSDAVSERVHATPKPLDDALGPDDPFQQKSVGQPVTAEGTWLTDSTVWIEDRKQGPTEERGYWLLTPLAVGDGTGPAVPVVLGWVSNPEAVAPPQGTANIIGWLQPPEGSQGVSDPDPSDAVLPLVRMADLVQHVDQDLYGGFIVLDHTQAANAATIEALPGVGAVSPEEVPPVSSTTGLRNFLYALEWWVFGAFVVFMWWRWCADQLATMSRKTEAEVVSSS